MHTKSSPHLPLTHHPSWKEAEKLPCEVEALFTSLHAQSRHAAKLKKMDIVPALTAIHGMLLSWARFLDTTWTYEQALSALSMNEDALFFELDSHGSTGSCAMHLANIRAKMARLHVIRGTSFFLPAYTLSDGIVSIVLGLLVTSKVGQATGYVNAFVFSCLFIYLGLLVRDIDNPFGYPQAHNERNLRKRKSIPMPFRAAIIDGSSIDFSILFVSFGLRLQEALSEHKVDEDALYSLAPPNRTSSSCHAGAAAALTDADRDPGAVVSAASEAADLAQPQNLAAMTSFPELTSRPGV